MADIPLYYERKCYYCGRGDEIEKDLMKALGKITTISESQRIREFELKEYNICLENFRPRGGDSDISNLKGLNFGMGVDSISIWVCPVCLCLVRDANRGYSI